MNIKALVLIVLSVLSMGASYRTENFIVTADTVEMAQDVAERAERQKNEVALEWFGKRQVWDRPWRIVVNTKQITSGQADNLTRTLNVNGPYTEIVEDVLPHEVLHAVFSERFGHFRPTWFHEGAASLEEETVKDQYYSKLYYFLRTDQGIPFNEMLTTIWYRPREEIPFYAQSTVFVDFLLERGGKQKLVEYVDMGINGDWNKATKDVYGFKNVSEMQDAWVRWLILKERLGQ